VFVAAGAAKYLCDDYGDPYAIAESTASAFAEAVAYAAASCVLIGDATANAHASANAKAQAEIWVTSYFDAWASASDCKKCDAYASSWGYIQKYVFLEAVANAEVKVCNTSYPANSFGKTHQHFWAIVLCIATMCLQYSCCDIQALSGGCTYHRPTSTHPRPMAHPLLSVHVSDRDLVAHKRFIWVAEGRSIGSRCSPPTTLCIAQLNLATSKDLKVIVKSVADYKYDIERVVVTAYAQALADANKYRKSSNCVAWVNAGGCIWTEGTDDEKYYCAGCSAEAYSEGSVSKIDAIATAGTFRNFTPLKRTVDASNCKIVTCIFYFSLF
jgi:hypothetical protein